MIKTIYLVRHAEPARLPNVPDDQWPLSARGHELASNFFEREILNCAVSVYTSPLLRAVQTAQHAEVPLTVDSRLLERRTGREIPGMGDCWLRQYGDDTFKSPEGESFGEVRQRMSACVEDILTGLGEGETAIVVSHAAAICAYLKRHCIINVTDRSSKTREIIWRGQRVYMGNLPPLTCIRLTFRQARLENIEVLT